MISPSTQNPLASDIPNTRYHPSGQSSRSPTRLILLQHPCPQDPARPPQSTSESSSNLPLPSNPPSPTAFPSPQIVPLLEPVTEYPSKLVRKEPLPPKLDFPLIETCDSSWFVDQPFVGAQVSSNPSPRDRRISLPLLGIDLGRSQPSYGQTLKRMTVAVYGTANNVFNESQGYKQPGDFSPRFLDSPINPTSTISTDCSPDVDLRPNINGLVQNQRPVHQDSNSLQGALLVGEELKPPEKSSTHDSRYPLPSSTTTKTKLLSASLGRSSTWRNPQAPSTKVERDSQTRDVNLPFKSNVKYLLRIAKLEKPRAANFHLSSQSDAGIDDCTSSHSHQAETIPGNVSPSTPSQSDQIWNQTNWKKKREVIRELVESERRYYGLLNKIQSNYILPIRDSQRTKDYQKMILSLQTTSNIFSNFAAILGLSEQFLASLENLARDHKLFDQPALLPEFSIESQEKPGRSHSQISYVAKKTSDIGELLLQFLPFFKLYTTFTSNFSVSQTTLHVHADKRGPSPQFVGLLEGCRRRGIDDGLGLAHMLLAIIQRVPRYELLIKELVKYSNQGHRDYENLLSAQRMVGLVARRLEIGMNEQAATKTILTIQRAMEGLGFPLVIPSRKLVKIGHLKKISRKGDLEDRIFFLFNDCLIYSGILKNWNVESVEKWLGRIGASSQRAPVVKSFPPSHVNPMALKPISSNFLLPFTNGDDNSPRLIFCRKLQLDDVTTVGAVSGRKHQQSRGFQIISSEKSFVVYAKNAEEKEQWISSLRETKSELLDGQRTLVINTESRNRDKTSQVNKLGNIAESPSPPQPSTPSLISSTDELKSPHGQPAIETTPQKSKDKTPSPFPIFSTCRSPINGYMITNLFSPRTRQKSTCSKSFMFNRKSPVNSDMPPLAAQTNQALEDIPETYHPSSFENAKMPLQSTVTSSESKRSNRLPNQNRRKFEDDSVSRVYHVAENYSAPVWIPDNHVERCMGKCQVWFSVIKRRHHCRLCGGVFCSSCSTKLFVITNRDQGDHLARACEACFKSVFLESAQQLSKSTSEAGSQQLILSNRPQDDHEPLMRRDRSHLKHAHRQSLPMDLGSAHFRHSLNTFRDEDPRRSIISSATSVGGESMCDGPKTDLVEVSNLELVDPQNRTSSHHSAPEPSSSQPHTQVRQRLTSLLQSQMR